MRFLPCSLVALVACSSSGAGSTHGPVFNPDGGGDVVVDHPTDASVHDSAPFDAPGDHHTGDSPSSQDARPDATRDAGAETSTDGSADTGSDATSDTAPDVLSDVRASSDASVCPISAGLCTV